MLAIRRMIHLFSVTILNIFQRYFETTRVTLFSGFHGASTFLEASSNSKFKRNFLFNEPKGFGC